MSFQAVAKAVDVELSGNLKLVFILMANYADENDCCYPSQQTLARQAGISEKTIQRVISKLEEQGFVKTLRKGTGNKSSLYRLIFLPQGSQNVTPDNLSGGQNDHPAQSNCLPRVVKMSTQGGQNDHRSYQDTINDTINTTGTEKSSRQPLAEKFNPEQVVLPSYVNRDSWIAYCKMRKAKRSGIKTNQTLRLCLRDLEKHSGGNPDLATAILEQSIANCWTGLFALKTEFTKRSGAVNAHDKSGKWAIGRTITVKSGAMR